MLLRPTPSREDPKYKSKTRSDLIKELEDLRRRLRIFETATGTRNRLERATHSALVEITFDSVGESPERKFVSDAVISLYAALAQSLLYPFNHPLVSDALKNAFQSLQKVFRKKPHLRLETAGEWLLLDGEVLDGSVLVTSHFASWLTSRNIKALSFESDLSRRELINFHRIISMKRLTFDEISKAMAEKIITNISVYPMEFSVARARVSPDDAAHQFLVKDYEGTRYHVDDVADHGLIEGYESTRLEPESPGGLSPFGADAEQRAAGQEVNARFDQGLLRDLETTSYHMESNQAQSPFFTRPPEANPLDNISSYGLIEGYEGTRLETESPEGLSALGTESGQGGSAEEFAEGSRHAECVEALLDHDLSEDDRNVLNGIPPEEMAHLLNAMLFRSPGGKVVDRVIEAYFGETGGVQAEETSDRCRTFLTLLKPDLRSRFAARCSSICRTDDLLTEGDADSLLQTGKVTAESSSAGNDQDAPTEQPSFVPHRTLEGSDFTFDFVAHGNAVLHDIEIPSETAALFNEAHMARFQERGVLDTLSSSVGDVAGDEGSHASIIAECTEETITEASFEVVLDLLDSDSLEEDAYRKLEGRLITIIELFLERGEFSRTLEVFNSLKSQSLQGKRTAHAAAMIRKIFSAERLNSKVVGALRQYGRKQRGSASKLAAALRTFLVPYLLDALGEEDDPSMRRFMMSLLTEVRSDVLRYIAKRLRDSRWYVSRNMLYLLRECHGRSFAETVREFLEHEEPLVRLEALRTLLSFQDPKAEAFVMKFLRSDVFQLQNGAVRLAGAYRVKYAVPHLIRLLLEKDIRGKKSLFKKGIIRALGRIGDARAVGHLLSICKSAAVLNKDEFDGLKIEIFRTLHNYPAGAIGPLIDYGIESANEEIVAISRKLMKQYGRPAGKE